MQIRPSFQDQAVKSYIYICRFSIYRSTYQRFSIDSRSNDQSNSRLNNPNDFSPVQRKYQDESKETSPIHAARSRDSIALY